MLTIFQKGIDTLMPSSTSFCLKKTEVIPAFKQTNYHKINYLGMMEEIAKINHKKKVNLI